MPTTYTLIPGAGGNAWYWHRVSPLLIDRGAEVITVDLPFDDDSADLTTYADIVYDELAGVPGPVILVGQSMGAFTVPMVAQRRPAALIVLVNPMVPAPGEAAGQWWAATGQEAARIDYFKRIGLGRNEFDPIEDFFHDVPEQVRQVALSSPSLPYPTHRSSSRGRWTVGRTCLPGWWRVPTTGCSRWSCSGR
jgi:pimeloyl-ACP methyl ester carboxylesterase